MGYGNDAKHDDDDDCGSNDILVIAIDTLIILWKLFVSKVATFARCSFT